MLDREEIEKFEPREPDSYKQVPLDYLVMYAIGRLEQLHVPLTFPNAVVAAYKLFPEKFSLIGFPMYPDAKRVHDCLFRCTFKDKEWLGGKTRQGFRITERSRQIIAEAEDRLSAGSSLARKAESQTRREEVLLKEVESSSAYKKYTTGDGDSVSEGEFCYVLQGTFDTSRTVLRKNLDLLKAIARETRQEDVLRFLKWLEQTFRASLHATDV